MSSALPKDLLDQRLPDWYRTAHIDLTGDTLDIKKATINALADEFSAGWALDAVAYASGDEPSGHSVIELIRETARKHDSTFAGNVGDAEPPLLLACAIAHHLAKWPTDAPSSLLAYGALSAQFRGDTGLSGGPDLADLSARCLAIAGDAIRTPANPPTSQAASSVKAALKGVASLPDDGAAMVDTDIGPWLRGLHSAVKDLASRADSMAARVDTHTSDSGEQIEMLTWLLEDFCDTAGTPWAEIGKSASLVAGVELARRTTLLPGPRGAGRLLDSTLIKAGRLPKAYLTPLAAIEEGGRLLVGVWDCETSHRLLPLSGALAGWKTTEGKSGWKAVSRTGMHGNIAKHTESSLAMQAYRELMIIRLL